MPKTLLLADDSVTIQKVVGISLANEDIRLVTVDNGDDAVARARDVQPDIVLADIVMPGKNGYEVCEAIKSDPGLVSVPVLLLTGTFEAFDGERARAAGADGHITKPFEAQALVDHVNELLARVASPPPAPPVSEDIAEPVSASPVEGPSHEDSDAFDFFDDDAAASPGALGGLSQPAEIQAEPLAFGSPDPDEPAPAPGPIESGDEWLAPAERFEARPRSLAPDAGPDAETSSLGGNEPLGETLPTFDARVGAGAATLPAGPASLTSPVWSGAAPEPEVEGLETAEFATEPPSGPMPNPDDSGYDLDSADLSMGTSIPEASRAVSFEPEGAANDDHSLSDEPGEDPLAGLDGDESLPEARVEASGAGFDLHVDPAPDPEEPPHGGDGVTEDEFPARIQHAAVERPTVADFPSAADDTGASPIDDASRRRIQEALEKIAWEAFSDLSETIVRQSLARVEAIAWEVIPQMAEVLIREEIQRLGQDEDDS